MTTATLTQQATRAQRDQARIHFDTTRAAFNLVCGRAMNHHTRRAAFAAFKAMETAFDEYLDAEAEYQQSAVGGHPAATTSLHPLVTDLAAHFDQQAAS